MAEHRFLGILLHAAVDGGEYLQAIGVDAVVFAVLLLVLVAPAVERVALPIGGIDAILSLVPRRVVLLVGLRGHQVLAHELAEIGGDALLVVALMELQLHLAVLHAVVFRLSQVARLHHLRHHHVAALLATVGESARVEVRGVLAEAYQRGALLQSQLARLLAEISVSGRLDAHRVMKEVEVVQVHSDDLLLGEVALQLDGDDPLDGFLQEAFHRAMRLLRIELLGQLLGDGAATAGTLLPHDATLHDGSPEGWEVDARMLVESRVFRSHEGVDEVGRELVVVHHDAVVAVGVPHAENLPVGRIHLRGRAAHGVLQILHIGHVAHPSVPDGHKAQKQEQHYAAQQAPKDFHQFFPHF